MGDEDDSPEPGKTRKGLEPGMEKNLESLTHS